VVTWAGIDELKVLLGVSDSDTSSDALLSQVLVQANEWAFLRRAETALYPLDDPLAAPDDSVVAGVLAYCLIQLRDRGFATPRFTTLDSTPTMTAVTSQLGLGGGGFA
jgi:hypothetical protein